jgi:hypothetical protein
LNSNEAQAFQNLGQNKISHLGSFNKDGHDSSLEKAMTNTQAGVSFEMIKNLSKMEEEYTRKNEKEVPSHSS